MKKLGEILIEHGSISATQLQEALDRQKKEPHRFVGELLIDMGYVTEEDIVVALATQFSIPYLPVANFTLNETVSGLIPIDLIREHICLPIDRIGNLLMVVMADPTDERAIQHIEEMTKCKVQVFVATPAEIISVIQQNYKINMGRTAKPHENVSQVSFRSAVRLKKEGLK